MSVYKNDRTAEDIKREITAVIRELKDPRVAGKMLTVVRVELANDLSFGKVYISAFDSISTAKEAVKGLEHAQGLIRREICSRLHLRKAPELKFIADDSVREGIELFRKYDMAKKDAKHEDND